MTIYNEPQHWLSSDGRKIEIEVCPACNRHTAEIEVLQRNQNEIEKPRYRFRCSEICTVKTPEYPFEHQDKMVLAWNRYSRRAWGIPEPEPKPTRPGWDVYFAQIARLVAERSTCSRRKVGAVIVHKKRILTTGYNGSPPGMPHCTDVGCLMVDGHCVRTIHAETNAIAQAAAMGVAVDGATLIVTAKPCYNCAKLIVAVGIKVVVYLEPYENALTDDLFRNAGVTLMYQGDKNAG